MKKLVLSKLLVAFTLLGSASAQQMAQIDAVKNTTIKAGETITFQIKLDTAPNFSGGSVSLTIGPKDTASKTPDIPSAASLSSEQGLLRLGFLIPVKSPSEKWHIKRLSFTVPGTSERPLNFTDVEFDVPRSQESDNTRRRNRRHCEVSDRRRTPSRGTINGTHG